jgi:hypothetical protein
MNKTIQKRFEALTTGDDQARYTAFMALLKATDKPVDWAYEIWDELVADLGHKDNHRRAIAAQLLCNLAKSDPKGRILKDFKALLAVTRDKRFVTARHCLQALWKVGAAGPRQRKKLIDGLAVRFRECQAERNCTLIRYDIIVGLRNLYDVVGGEKIRETALAWIETEDDPKYRKKYAGVWRGV